MVGSYSAVDYRQIPVLEQVSSFQFKDIFLSIVAEAVRWRLISRQTCGGAVRKRCGETPANPSRRGSSAVGMLRKLWRCGGGELSTAMDISALMMK